MSEGKAFDKSSTFHARNMKQQGGNPTKGPQPSKEHPCNATADSILRLKKIKLQCSLWDQDQDRHGGWQLPPPLVNMVTGLPTSPLENYTQTIKSGKEEVMLSLPTKGKDCR